MLCMQENLNLNLRTCDKEPGVVAGSYDPRSGEEEAPDPRGSLASWSTLVGELLPKERLCQNKTVEDASGTFPEVACQCPHIGTCAHMQNIRYQEQIKLS